LLARYGADVDASVNHPTAPSAETPLHWAASCDDVALIDALLNAGANIVAEESGNRDLVEWLRDQGTNAIFGH
jgi:ankyrin repeat protein